MMGDHALRLGRDCFCRRLYCFCFVRHLLIFCSLYDIGLYYILLLHCTNYTPAHASPNCALWGRTASG